MMMVANQVLSVELYKASSWTTLYWWNLEKPKEGKPRWKLDSKKGGVKSIPAYNFDFLFEKMRPVFLLQSEDERLKAFDILLQSLNPADALCKLAVSLAEGGLVK
jgi:hypothetical protein